jgi:hypothetical protein
MEQRKEINITIYLEGDGFSAEATRNFEPDENLPEDATLSRIGGLALFTLYRTFNPQDCPPSDQTH